MYNRFIGLIIIVFCLINPQSARTAQTAWKAGLGKEKITPEKPIWMTGYATRTHPADGTAEDLWVKALALCDPEGNKSVVLTLDLCGITREISDTVALEITRRYNIPRSAVMVNVSHTHCSPWIEGNLIGLRLFPESGYQLAHEYSKWLKTKMIIAADHALQTLSPSTLSWSEDVANFAMNRRENPEKFSALRKAAGTMRGPIDYRVPVLIIRDQTTQIIKGLLVSYACHNTTLSYYKWNGDYAGYAQLELEKRHPGSTVLFAIGCGGDVNPNPRGTEAFAIQHGKALADAADRAITKLNHSISGNFSSSLEDIKLHFLKKPTEEKIASELTKNQPAKEMHQAWATVIEKQLKNKGDDILTYDYPIQTWKIGNLMWAGLGGEAVCEYGLKLRANYPGNLWVFSYCNDVMAYIPNERILKEGQYEGETSMIPYGRPSTWEAGLEDKIINKTHILLVRTASK